ncbi:hypothetical protein MUK42_33503 [Musa troglodytarum]|uniref:Uncharacterized protein n=1 Tax=Musa troglodytarum TaxID=320322 RepID=A0A9E7FDJ9_9LILI|nr:hypothetical protein MUK42_33503 [Musa troglodytarum]
MHELLRGRSSSSFFHILSLVSCCRMGGVTNCQPPTAASSPPVKSSSSISSTARLLSFTASLKSSPASISMNVTHGT